MTEQGRIVDLSRKHLDKMVEMHLETHRLHQSAFPEVFSDKHSPTAARRTLERYLPRWLAFDPFTGQGIGWEEGDELVGYILYQTFEHQIDFGMNPGIHVVIADIAVEKTRRRQGIGANLVKELVKRVQLQGAVAIEAQIWNRIDESAAFIENAGFRSVSQVFRLPLP